MAARQETIEPKTEAHVAQDDLGLVLEMCAFKPLTEIVYSSSGAVVN